MITMGKIVFDTTNMELTREEIERMVGNLQSFLESERDAALEKEKKETRAKELEAEIIDLRGNLATAMAEYISAISEKVTGERMSIEECGETYKQIYNLIKQLEGIEEDKENQFSFRFEVPSINFKDLIEKPKISNEKPNVSKSAKQNFGLTDEDILKTFAKIFGE